ncbi:lysozyme inhibitor LprI family protein [Stenotrophomonas sp. 24(2023)]|uniref:lysozyme inhibitor LprI family protein n=1 Tax=Stenotrophomonas sp. 24(2023) TaxID=3068324 RepID=UPI0027E0BC40|nr:lysozyme inhibitor LprI family protein [Stenotrophomonas sp. 24(2023)]WMJ68168.1 lysozyme inhibitor LprI family protein [Stenotrophomonas sp. 24(2023)]
MKALLALALLLGTAAPAWAEGADADDCNAEGTQTELNACADRNFRKADAELNAVYRQVLAKLAGQPVALTRLKDAQRLWVQLRDADLEARYPVGKDENPRFLYGSMYPMLYLHAKTGLTETRTAYLRSEFLERSEYDL